MDNKDAQNLIDEEKIKLINEAYEVFLREIKKIEKERDGKIMAIMKNIDNRLLEEIKKDIKNSL